MSTVSPRQLSVIAVIFLFFGTLISGGHSVNQSASSVTEVQPAREGYVLRADQGEVIQRGKGNTIRIKVDPKTGSPEMAAGTQRLEPGAGIPVHLHEREDEMLFVHEGSGIAVMGNSRKVVNRGDTIFIPHGTWHGIETQQQDIELLWVVTPAGLEQFFRELGSVTDTAKKGLTATQVEDIGRKHGVRFKPR
jgi:quercetin dioxygenase-like cupin family protein